MPTVLPARLRFVPVVLFATALGAACLQGARAPEVAPRGTLAPGATEAALSKPEGPFGVVFAAPRGPTIDPAEITLVWNRPLRPLEAAGEETKPPVVMTPAAPGHWIWVGTSGVSFNPEGHLARATEYTIEVPAGTRALDGAVMDKAFVLHFSTARPKLESADADPGGPDAVQPGAKIALRFDQPVAEAEAARALRLTAAPPKSVEVVPVAFTIRRPDPKNDQLLELVPSAPLPLDAALRLEVDKGLRGREGPLLSTEEQSFDLHTYGPLVVEKLDCDRDGPRGGCTPDGGLTLALSNPVKFGDLKKALRVEPAVKIRWATWMDDETPTQQLAVWARFQPGRTYRVSLGPVKDVHGQPLAHPFSGRAAFDDLWPTASIGLHGTYVEPLARRGIPVASINVKELGLATAPLDEAAILALEGDEHHPGHAPRIEEIRKLAGAKVTTLRPAAGINKVAEALVAPDEVLGGPDRRGAIAVAIGYVERPGTHRSRRTEQGVVAQVTDLAISAKVSPHGSLVWVTHLGSAAPVAGASVRILRPDAPNGQAFTTDADGVAVVPEAAWKPVAAGEERAVIFARLGDDWAYRRVADALNGYRLGVTSDLGPDRPFGMVFTDRGIYRPGDTVHVKGIFREEAARGTATPFGRTVELTIEGPDGDDIAKQSLPLTPFGTVVADVQVPETGRLGTYAVQATVQGSPREYPDVTGDFEVSEYRPAEFKVGVQSDRPSYVRGDKASWTARADYLFGAPMSGADAQIHVTRAETTFTPPGTDDFATNDETWLSGKPEATERESEVQTDHTKLDAKGAATAGAALTLPGQHGPELVTCEADVTDLSRQTLSGSTSALVHPGEFYLGVRTGEELFVDAAKPLKAEILAVDPKGRRVPGVTVTVELIQRRWTIAKQAVGGGFRTSTAIEDKVVSTCSVTTASQPASCAVGPTSAGYYVLRASAKDRRGNAVAASDGLYATGGTGETSWGDSDTLKVDLVPDRKSYEVGQTARVLVKSPFKSADAWVTVERGGVYVRRRVQLSGPMPTVDVPITDDLRPNAFVSVLLVRARTKAPPAKLGAADVGAPAFRVGYAELPVDPEARRLAVAIKPSRAELRPGDPIDVDVDVKDRAGKPARAEVTLYAVDEGVLSLVGYKTPDPLPFFGAPRSLKVATIESREAVAHVMNPFSDLGLDKGLDGGGGAAKPGGARRDFRASAYWGPSLVTDEKGHVRASFKLPDSLTTYRVMAVATAEDDRFGFGEDRVVTSRPLMARPAFPRFVRAGDTLSAGVVLTSKGLPRSRVEVEIAASGITVKGDAKKAIDLDANGSAEVRFDLEANQAGKATVSFHASGGGAEDRVEITRDVKVPLVMEAAALYGDTSHEAAEKLGDLSSLRDDVGGLEVSLSSTALVGLGDAVEQLLDYPYGCTEQLVSRLAPMLPLRDLANDYGVALPKDLDRVLVKTVAEVLEHQRSDGGFGLWADSPDSLPFVSAYALWGLTLAKEHGVAVSETALDSASRYLRETALADIDKDGMAFAAAPFVLDVLAAAGAPDPGRVSQVFDARARLPLFSQAELLHAMVLSKSDPAGVEALAGEIEGHVRIDADVARAVANEGDRYAVLMDSETRTSALVLRGLIAARPAHALGARLAMGLLAARRGGAWRNTQEAAWSLLALDDYRKAQEKAEPDFVAHAFLGQTEIETARFHGRSLLQPRASVPAEGLVRAAGEPLGFTVEGQGRLFYEARLRYAKKTLPREGLERGFYVKKILRVVKPEGLDEALRTLPDASARAFLGADLVLGDVIVVTTSPRDLVVVDDPLPAGFEAVDARLATTGSAASLEAAEARADADDEDDDTAAADGARASAYVREVRDDRVLFFVDHMPAGMFHYRYLARATSLGTFVLPPTKVEEMYTPEVFGRTGADVVRVSDR